MEVITQVPHTNPFVPLAEHQSTTPASFHDGPPVLYYQSRGCKIIILEEELQHAPALSNLVRKITVLNSTSGGTAEEINGTHSKQITLEEIDIWVTSEKFLLYSNAYETGLSIPYPTISLHAIQSLSTPSDSEPLSQGLYMQLIPSMPSSNDEEPPDTISLTIIPTAPASPRPANAEGDELEIEDESEDRPVMALFKALSDCSNLHPDPVDPDDEDESRLMHAGLALPGTSDGTLPPPMPGSGGWITAENMHEFIDADGNFIDDNDGADDMDQDTEELGPGAGTVRSHPADTDGDASQGSKWRRTS